MNEDDVPSLWENLIQPLTIVQPVISPPTEEGVQLLGVEKPDDEKSEHEVKEQIQGNQPKTSMNMNLKWRRVKKNMHLKILYETHAWIHQMSNMGEEDVMWPY